MSGNCASAFSPEVASPARMKPAVASRGRGPPGAAMNGLLCDGSPGVEDAGFCGHCHWALRAEIEEGWFRMRNSLRKWANFRDWELATSPAGPSAAEAAPPAVTVS